MSAIHTAEGNLLQLVDEHGWFTLSNDGVVRCPLLVKGRLVDPPEVSLDAISGAFAILDERRGSADAYAMLQWAMRKSCDIVRSTGKPCVPLAGGSTV